MLPLLAALLPLLSLSNAASQGSVSLWSDSSCKPGASPNFGERDPVALNYTLDVDTCGNPGAIAHSYTVIQRPTCANGSVAAFAFYSTANCVFPPEGFSAYNQFNPSKILDGVCLALVQFTSVAFICDGIGNGNSSVGVHVEASPSDAPAASSHSIAYATPIAPSAKITAPIYTTAAIATGISPSGVQPSATGASAAPALPSFAPPTDEFTGAALKLGSPLVKVLVLVGAPLLLRAGL